MSLRSLSRVQGLQMNEEGESSALLKQRADREVAMKELAVRKMERRNLQCQRWQELLRALPKFIQFIP